MKIFAQVVISAAAEGEAGLEKVRVAGNSLSRRCCDGDDLKQDVQETEEQWRGRLQSFPPLHR